MLDLLVRRIIVLARDILGYQPVELIYISAGRVVRQMSP